ncbi:MAG: DUF3488 domain-containing protein [Phycisphaeraceae bacterium]|nr:DUF3488 domain-containing protein [Phycisphaeraceae bacterium]
MGLIYLFRRLVSAQVLLGIVAFCMAEPNPGMLLVAGALGALSWYVVEGPTGKPLPQWVILPGAVLAVGWLLVDLWWQHGQIIGAMGHFTMWLQILLLYAKKTNREYGEILVLSLMQMIGASVLTVSMIFGVLLTAYCVLALFTLLLFHLKATSDLILDANRLAAPAYMDLPRPKAVVCRGHRWQFRGIALGVGAGCCFVAVFVFLAIPRSGQSQLNPNLGQGYGQSSGAGFNTTIKLDGKPINSGPLTPSIYIKLTKDGLLVNDTDLTFLLRGATMDDYSSATHTWSRTNLREYDRDVELPVQLAVQPTNSPIFEAQITQRGGSDMSNLFSLADYPTISFKSADLAKIKFNTLDYQFNTHKSFRGALHYTIRAPMTPGSTFFENYPQIRTTPGQVTQGLQQGRSQFNQENYALHWKDRRQKQIINKYTQHILNSTSTHKKKHTDGRKLTADQKDQVVTDLSNYLRDNFTYQIESTDLSKDREPITSFLFTSKAGHCELFAAGLAAMTRSLNIKARVVTGYRVSEYNRFGGYYVARPIHAHAWAEVELSPGVWKIFDATPPQLVAREHAQNRNMFDPARELYEFMEFLWVDTVVSYDSKRQMQMVSGATHTLKAVTRSPNKHLVKMIKWIKQLPQTLRLNTLSYSIMGLILFFIILGLASLLHIIFVQRRRLSALQLQRLSRKDRKALAKRLKWYLVMLDILERNGYIRPIWQSPLDFSRELAKTNPNRFNPVVSLSEIFYEIRFGHREMDEARKGRVQSNMRALEHALVRRAVKSKT